MSDDWRTRAACLDEDPELFFPIGTHPDRRTTEAKALCATCPVINECATYALETRQAHGVWGGLSEADRERLWRRQARQRTRGRSRPPTPHEKAVTARAARVEAVTEYAADTEARVRRLTVEGMSLTQIAQRMNISPRQVGRYRARLRAGVA